MWKCDVIITKNSCRIMGEITIVSMITHFFLAVTLVMFLMRKVNATYLGKKLYFDAKQIKLRQQPAHNVANSNYIEISLIKYNNKVAIKCIMHLYH